MEYGCKVAQMAIISWCMLFSLYDMVSPWPSLQTTSSFFNGSGALQEPQFLEKIENITVPVGRRATLTCVVDHLGNYKVAWLFAERYTLLTFSKNVVTHNQRIRVMHPDQKTWHLIIHDVQKSDHGAYMCQINTAPMKYQVGYLNVVAPTQINETASSSDVLIAEGDFVAFRCMATGIPPPAITWTRQLVVDSRSPSKTTHVSDGEWYNISAAQKGDFGAYICTASNGIAEPATKRMLLQVTFSPRISIPNQTIGAALGASANLECILESLPASNSYWIFNNRTIASGVKYTIHESPLDHLDFPTPRTRLRLSIRNLQLEDFGEYTCLASSVLGSVEASLKLYDEFETRHFGKELNLVPCDQVP